MSNVDLYCLIIENIKSGVTNQSVDNTIDKNSKIINLLDKLEDKLKLSHKCSECRVNPVLNNCDLCDDCNFEKYKDRCEHCGIHNDNCIVIDIDVCIFIIDNIKFNIINEPIDESEKIYKNIETINLLDKLQHILKYYEHQKIIQLLKDRNLCDDCNFEKHKVQCVKCGIYAILNNTDICIECDYKNSQGICSKCDEFKWLIRDKKCQGCFTL